MNGAILTTCYASPCGELMLGAYGGRICLCDWGRAATARRVSHALGAALVEGPTDVAALAARQLDEYFAGERRAFSVPLLPVGTELQMQTWQALAEIPYGATTTYGALARLLGRPTAVRAVAAALGANALSLLLPCHRVVGSGGSLTGYAGGLSAKSYLLELESSVC